ncbi:OsmC family protein [Marinobacter sp. SBS5]|uniref:OsmC family protein n=1 Tax=Marinobacter sp. SBS5 TaxID=3401754 RepID=UPI003AAB8FD6
MAIKLSKSELGKYRQLLQIDQHEIGADARIDADTDTAPDPHDLYDSALAACKAITLLMYAEKANIPLEDVEIDVTRDNSEERSGTYRLHVDLRLKGPLEKSHLGRLEKVAEKCPVHKLMTAATTVVTSSCKIVE